MMWRGCSISRLSLACLILLGAVLLYNPALCQGQFATSGPEMPLGAAVAGQSVQPADSYSPHILDGVPAYLWYNGCGPTSLGMIIGYWDSHGYPNLIPGGNDWATNQTAIQNVIASPGNIRDYAPTPDRVATPSDPYHTDDSLADFDGCSRDPLQWGWSYLNMQSVGLMKYMDYCGYPGAYSDYGTYAAIWPVLVTEINEGDPVQIMVDSDGDGVVDHFVTGIGYDESGGIRRFACYNTWDLNVHWYDLDPVAVGVPFGAYAITMMDPPEVPEPTLLMPLALLITLWRRKRLSH